MVVAKDADYRTGISWPERLARRFPAAKHMCCREANRYASQVTVIVRVLESQAWICVADSGSSALRDCWIDVG